jgi:hypothetical protein
LFQELLRELRAEPSAARKTFEYQADAECAEPLILQPSLASASSRLENAWTYSCSDGS